MTPREADPAKKGEPVRIHTIAKGQADQAHIKYMKKVGYKMRMTDFMDLVINKGVKALEKGN